MKYVICILSISLAKALTFPTSFGDCTLTIYDGKIKQSPELVSHIQSQTEEMVKEWGVIIKKPFSSKLIAMEWAKIWIEIDKKGKLREWCTALYYGAKKEFSSKNGPFLKIY